MRASLLLFFLLTCVHAFCQLNLVINFSFEDTLSCPSLAGELNKSINWMDANSSKSDYYNSCSTSPSATVPSNSMGTQSPRTGNAYAGILVKGGGGYPADTRSYLQTRLSSPLLSGKQYCISFYVSLADNFLSPVYSIGAYLSATSISSNLTTNIAAAPQVSNPAPHYLSSTSLWMVVSDTITSAGGEEYLIIGNFNNDASTPSGGNTFTYYYVDDVFVMPLENSLAGNDVSVCTDSVRIGTSPVAGAEYLWYPPGGLSSATVANPNAKPGTSTTYTLIVRDTNNASGCNTVYDEITVTAGDCAFYYAEPANTFSPNYDGMNDFFTILSSGSKQVNCKIYNRWGVKIYEWNGPEGFWDGRTSAGLDCPEGVYYFVFSIITGENKEVTERGFVHLFR